MEYHNSSGCDYLVELLSDMKFNQITFNYKGQITDKIPFLLKKMNGFR